eukprot:TRINITY_DN1420_c0_g1_i1.p1 TRINITY_DN1420_c0_g1~~TRINITY_DN1420_c0_g1_i1.p1  ORF type:complete len:277 (-),score=67.00 TRINITY_DN1420_c0_g1_i1:76-906(-)
MFQNLLNVVNKAKARTENRMRIEQIQKKLRKGNEKVLDLVSQKRKLLSEGTLKICSDSRTKEGYYYLFNDIFIYTRSDGRQIQFEIPLRFAWIVKRLDDELRFEVWNTMINHVNQNNTLMFECQDTAEKNKLLELFSHYVGVQGNIQRSRSSSTGVSRRTLVPIKKRKATPEEVDEKNGTTSTTTVYVAQNYQDPVFVQRTQSGSISHVTPVTPVIPKNLKSSRSGSIISGDEGSTYKASLPMVPATAKIPPKPLPKVPPKRPSPKSPEVVRDKPG